jgi:hypothetical protein
MSYAKFEYFTLPHFAFGIPVDILDVYWIFTGFSLPNFSNLSTGCPVNVLYQPKFHWIVQDTYPVNVHPLKSSRHPVDYQGCGCAKY